MTTDFYATAGWLTLLLFAELVADTYVKKAALGTCALIWPAVLYGLIGLLFVQCNRTTENLGMMNMLWNVFSTLNVLLLGAMLFGEKINPREWFGIALTLAGLMLMVRAE